MRSLKKNKLIMKAIIGLGNPGLRYKFTKHNIGFIICQQFAKRHKIKIRKRLYGALVGEGKFNKDIDVKIVLPQTYMNNSGESVATFLKSNTKMDPTGLLVVCDDINLPLGVIRIRQKGSAGGHKGLESIIKILETQNFARLRVGIGPETDLRDKKDFVLTPFKRGQLKKTQDAIKLAADACETWVGDGTEVAMNRFNAKLKC